MDAEPKSNVRPDAPPELPLCLGCAQPNDPAANFCSHCGAPMTSYASTGPFESLFAEGRAYREAADHPRSPVVVAGVWLLFGMMFLGGLLLTSPALHGDFLIAIPGLLLMGLSLTMLVKTTRNFLSGRESRGARIGDPDEDSGVPLP